ncbi:MAG: YfhO family protein, partial [Armatimonadetes bacterium]|nr:YfhO family protein [Armatimonadota bacterium]
MKRRLSAEAAAYGLFLVLGCLLVWPVLLRGEVLLPLDYVGVFHPWQAEAAGAPTPERALPWNALLADSVLQYLPWRQFARESLRGGFLPLWNPHQFCGTPFIANYQSAVFYPPNLLFWILPAARAFGFAALGHLFLAGAFAYLYLRGRGLGRFAACVGGSAFELCGFVVAWLELPTAVNVMVWLPLALHLYERGRTRNGWRRGLPTLFPLTMILLAGHPQFAAYALLGFVAYALAVPPPGAGWRQRLAGLMPCAVVPLALAVLLAAPQLLPVLELSGLSHRAGAAPLLPSAESYRLQALPFRAAVALLMPGFYGHPNGGDYWGPANHAEFAGYFGVLPLLLALLAMMGVMVPSWRATLPEGAERRIAVLAAVAAGALLGSFRTPPGEALHAVIPGLGGFGSPGRMLSLASVAVALLAGFGAHLLAERRVPARRLLLGALLLGIGGAGLWVAATLEPTQRLSVSFAT